MKIKIVAIYSIFLGFSIIFTWTLVLITQKIPEGFIEFSFHLFSEFLMALILLISGIMLLTHKKLAIHLNILGLGMSIISVLNAAGYYGQRIDTVSMILFIFLFIFSTIAIYSHFKIKKAAS